MLGILWSTPGRWGGMNPEGIPRRTFRYDARVSRIIDLSVGEAHPGKLRAARAVVKRWSRSASVSNVDSRTGSLFRGEPNTLCSKVKVSR